MIGTRRASEQDVSSAAGTRNGRFERAAIDACPQCRLLTSPAQRPPNRLRALHSVHEQRTVSIQPAGDPDADGDCRWSAVRRNGDRPPRARCSEGRRSGRTGCSRRPRRAGAAPRHRARRPGRGQGRTPKGPPGLSAARCSLPSATRTACAGSSTTSVFPPRPPPQARPVMLCTRRDHSEHLCSTASVPPAVSGARGIANCPTRTATTTISLGSRVVREPLAILTAATGTRADRGTRLRRVCAARGVSAALRRRLAARGCHRPWRS